MLTVQGGLAEFERELSRAHIGEGRARAVANGVRLGRKPPSKPLAALSIRTHLSATHCR
jgi:DNA invertase Pin-like site-specific DNA recombinase